MTDLPTVPDDFVELAITCAFNRLGTQQSAYTGDVYSTKRVVQKDGKQVISRIQPRFGLEDVMSAWTNTHISTEWSQIGVATSILSQQAKANSQMQSPHTDGTRSYALLYLLESSNADQDTVFWHEPGYPIHRKRTMSPLNLDHLIKIDSVRIPLHTWTYIDSTILHSVENVTQSRITLQISFDCDPFGIFVKS
jgi:hypothetical protein